MDRLDKELLVLLKKEIWIKAFGNSEMSGGNYYYEQIRKKILKETGHSLSKDTIRNFYEGKHSPSLKTLDILSDFVLEGEDDSLRNYSDFKIKYEEKTSDDVTSLEDDNKISLSIKGVILLFLAIIISWFWYSKTFRSKETQSSIKNIVHTNSMSEEKVRPFNYTFNGSNLKELKEDGWYLFPDSIDHSQWDKEVYRENGYLTLETHLGGPWVENRDFIPKTVNVLAHPIQCGDCCEISVKLVDFNPYQRYQQAGFFLYYSDHEIPSISYVFSCGSDQNQIQSVLRDDIYSNEDLIPPREYQDRIRISKILNKKFHKKRIPKTTVDSVVFKLVLDSSHYFFSYKTNDNQFIPVASKIIPFDSPEFIGLSAYQGRPDIPYPVYDIADVIPAKFKYVKILSCE